jgi:DNA modification methylase
VAGEGSGTHRDGAAQGVGAVSVRILIGDVREQLRTLPDESVHCVVTSPPYWGLRDYGVEGQLGLEPTLGEHLAVMVEVFRDVRRVLRKDGTLWLNYGDCYATSVNGRSAADTKAVGNDDRTFRDKPFSTIGGVLKAKDLCMVPNRLAIALQEDGWWVRSEIVWGKPNPMPDSSGKYRPSTAHEKIFLLSKSGKCFYDAEAVAKRPSENSHGAPQSNPGAKQAALGRSPTRSTLGVRTQDKQRGHSRRHAGFNDRWDHMERSEQISNGRYLRNYEPADLPVWNIAPQPFPDAHFATFPPELAERCIKAGCPEGGTVLDCFGGSGTTALVAHRLHYDSIIIELNPAYAEIARGRIDNDVPLLATIGDHHNPWFEAAE